MNGIIPAKILVRMAAFGLDLNPVPMGTYGYAGADRQITVKRIKRPNPVSVIIKNLFASL